MAEDQSLDHTTIFALSTDDIIPNVYEGGFKTWECSLDLAEYLLKVLYHQHSPDQAIRHFIEVQTL